VISEIKKPVDVTHDLGPSDPKRRYRKWTNWFYAVGDINPPIETTGMSHFEVLCKLGAFAGYTGPLFPQIERLKNENHS
jgi:hypothetical protein